MHLQVAIPERLLYCWSISEAHTTLHVSLTSTPGKQPPPHFYSFNHKRARPTDHYLFPVFNCQVILMTRADTMMMMMMMITSILDDALISLFLCVFFYSLFCFREIYSGLFLLLFLSSSSPSTNRFVLRRRNVCSLSYVCSSCFVSRSVRPPPPPPPPTPCLRGAVFRKSLLLQRRRLWCFTPAANQLPR